MSISTRNGLPIDDATGALATTGGGSSTPAASAVTFTPTGTIGASNVQAAIAEVATDAIAREAALAAAGIAFTPTGTIAATNVQAAIAEVAAEAGGGAASTITFTPTGGIAATNVQAAIAEVETDAIAREAALSGLTQNTQTANYVLALADAGKVVEMNLAGANTVTVPLNATVAFPIGTVIQVCQLGAGQTTITPTGGVTLRQASSLTTRAQYSTVVLRKRATDEWVVGGDAT